MGLEMPKSFLAADGHMEIYVLMFNIIIQHLSIYSPAPFQVLRYDNGQDTDDLSSGAYITTQELVNDE